MESKIPENKTNIMESKSDEKKLPKNFEAYSIPSADTLKENAEKMRSKIYRTKIFVFANTKLKDFITKLNEATNRGETMIDLYPDEEMFVNYFKSAIFGLFSIFKVEHSPTIQWWTNKLKPVPKTYMYTPDEDNTLKQKTFIWQKSGSYRCIREDGETQSFDTLDDFHLSEW